MTEAGHRDERRGVERLEAFSDGVFAIAITLLVLGIGVPEVSEERLGSALSDLVPSILAYFLGFAVIGLFWIRHHSFYAQVERHDGRLLWTNLVFLSLIAAMPFSTGLIGEYGSSEAATMVFAANVALAALANYGSEWEARRSGLLSPDSPRREGGVRSRALLVPLIFGLSIPLALVSVSAAQLLWLATLLGRPGRAD
jgi:uncharacterized membrane protein